jgi:hypothetical protein
MRSTPVFRALLAGALLALAVSASASAEGATTTVIHFQPEGLPPLEAQIRHHEVHALTFHPTPEPGHVHISMNDGRHFTAVYAASEQAHLIALATANGARYAIAKAEPKPAATTHHTLRYIAAGILIVVIVIVAAVLLVDRRRKLNA